MTALNALPAATDAGTQHTTMRKTSNLLALCVASYREGDVDTAFDLFISGMQSHLNDRENANVGVDPRTFGEIIEAALTRAAAAADEDEALEAAETADLFDLAELSNDDLEIGDVMSSDAARATDEEEEEEESSLDERLDALAAGNA